MGEDSEFQALKIPCDFPPKTHLGVKIALKGLEPIAKPVKTKRAKERMDSAKQYLVEHGLEELLAESMREIIQQKPSDPFTFLAGLLLKHASSTGSTGAAAKSTQAADKANA